MQKSILFLVFFVLVFNDCFSQITVRGNVLSANDEPISGASITLTQIGTNNIIAYDISDSKGRYHITYTAEASEVNIQVRKLGFTSITKTIANKTQTLDFHLKKKAVDLKEVYIEYSPITRKGDTINYTVNSFAQKQDRTIADVLEHMPGIDVLDDGTILYQDKPINKYYIEGLDLLGGKYNLANENLPYKAVSKVQILENHQPIRMLDSLVYSDKAALNIKLKNEYTFTGQAELGAGLSSSLLWDANITPLLFTEKQQMLVSYQANNTGENVGAQLKTLSLQGLLNQFKNGNQKQDWLEIQHLHTPDFSEKRWLDNNVHLLSGNYLQKLKKNYVLRLNVSYLNDYQKQNGRTKTYFFTERDTISVLEKKFNQLYFNSLDAKLTLLKNTAKNYLKNSLQFQGFWDSQTGNILTNQEPLTQHLSNRFFKVSNHLKTIFPIGKQLMNLNSYFGYSQTPQTLVVNPGQFQDLLNNGNRYDEILQKINLNTFYTNNSIGFVKGWKRFSFSPKIGFKFKKQNLKSKIAISENQILDNRFSNNLSWIQSKFYFNLQTQYKKSKWSLELNTPINFYSFNIKDVPLGKAQDLNQLTFEPNLSINFEANTFWEFSTAVRASNHFGSINQLHYAYILQNYRNIKRVNTVLPQTLNHSFSGRISYQNLIKSFSWNLFYVQVRSKNNLLYQTHILANGATELQAIEKENYRTNQSISTRLSKYFGKLNTNISLNANFGMYDFQQILNSEISNIQYQNWGFGGKIETDFTNWFNTKYQAKWMFSKNQIQKQSNKTIAQQRHLLHLYFYPKANQFFAIKTEYIKSNIFSQVNENVFASIIYRYTWKKKNIDFELQWNNIFNTEIYKTININDYSYVETNFKLRPSQLLFTVRLSL